MLNNGKIQHAISMGSAFLIVGTAIGYDLSQAIIDLLHFIPVAGNILATILTAMISLWAYLTFYIWFKIKGLSFTSAKRGLTLVGGFFIELLPIINALPAWTLAVVLIIATTRAEEAIQKATGVHVPIAASSAKVIPVKK